jgi:Tfp pilus assembly PilM family ATPase
MHAHLGLACCVESINYARFLADDQKLILDHIGSISYPFAYNESEFFSEENINSLANLLKSNILADNTDYKNLSVSIETNLAMLKRIALPDNLDREDENDHIAWDLSNSLIEPLDQYIYYKTPNSFKNDNYTDFLTIAIRKNIVNSLRRLSELVGLNLVDISVNQLNTETVLQNSLNNQCDGLIAIFKIANSRLESTFLWNGNYYTSHYDRLIQESAEDDFSTKIKSKLKQMENLFEQIMQKQIKIEQVHLYGEQVNEKFIEAVQKKVSVAIQMLDPLQNVEKSEKLVSALPAIEETSKYVESIGVVLDQ